jgi:hypothetical protein
LPEDHKSTAARISAATANSQVGKLDNSLSAELAIEDTESATTFGSLAIGSRYALNQFQHAP